MKDNKKQNKNDDPIEKQTSPLLNKDVDFLSSGLMILVCFVICGGAGYLIDKHYSTDKYTTYGVLFGLVCGFYYFIKAIIEATRGK